MVIHYTSFGSNDDDDWDDAPPYAPPTLPKRAPEPPPKQAQSSASSMQVPLGSSVVSMQLDAGLLPVRLTFGANWSQHVSPAGVGRELLMAYRAAISQRMARFFDVNGGLPPDGLPHSSSISRTTQLSLLLDTSEWDEYQRVFNSITSLGDYRVEGQTLDYDMPVVTATADNFSITAFNIWPQWKGCSDPLALEGEILTCAARIRELRPNLTVYGDYSQYTEDDLEYQHQRHRLQLIERASF